MLPLTKPDLMRVPSRERECLVAFMVMGTEVNTLLSCVLLAGSPPGCSAEVESRVQTAQEFHLARLLACTLHESWLAVQKLFTACPQAANLKAYLRDGTQAAYDWLKSSYGKKDSTLATVRNKLGSHYDPAAIGEGFTKVPDDAAMEVCFGDQEGQRRWLGGAIVMANAVAPVTGKSDTNEALRKFLQDATDVADRMSVLLGGWAAEVLWTHLSSVLAHDIVLQDASRAHIPASYDLATYPAAPPPTQPAPGALPMGGLREMP